MTYPTRTRRLSAAAAAALLLAGCTITGGTEDPTTTEAAPTTEVATTTVPPATTEAAATSEPPVLSPAEQDQADIEATVVAYLAALDAAYGGAEVEGIYPWSRDTARDKWTTQVMAYREQGLTIEGERQIVDGLDIEVNEDQADVIACLDYSDIVVTDGEGEDATPARDEGQELLSDLVLERAESAEHGWVVVNDTHRNEPCDA